MISRFAATAFLALFLSPALADDVKFGNFQIMRERDLERHPDLEEVKKKDLPTDLALPAAPQPANLVEFFVGPTEPNRIFVDTASLSVMPDGMVSYTVIVKTEGGASNVTFESVSCPRYARMIYALGRSDGSWTRVRNPAWRPVDASGSISHILALVRDVFCDVNAPAGTAEQIARNLRSNHSVRR